MKEMKWMANFEYPFGKESRR